MLRKSLLWITLLLTLLLAAGGSVWAADSALGDAETFRRPRPTPSPSPTPVPSPVSVEGFVCRMLPDLPGFRLLTMRGKVDILVTNTTEFEIPGVENPGLDDVRVGDHALVSGEVLPTATAAHRLIRADRVIIRRPHPHVAGWVSALLPDLPGFKLRSHNREWTIEVTRGTQFIIPGVEDPWLDDVRVGDYAEVFAEPAVAETPVIRARLVIIRRPVRPVTLRGRIVRKQMEEPQAFWLEVAPDDVKEIGVTTETRFQIPGVRDPDLGDVRIGDRATVTALLVFDETAASFEDARLIAKLVVVHRPRPVTLYGVIEGVRLEEPQALWLNLPSGVVKEIACDEETRYRIPGVEDPTLENVRIGDRAIVVAIPVLTYEESATNIADVPLLARLVVIHRPAPRPVRLSGIVTAKEGTILTVQTEEGEKIVQTDEETRFRVPGVSNPTIEDVNLGDNIQAVGFWNDDGSLQAKLVVVLPEPAPMPTPTPPVIP